MFAISPPDRAFSTAKQGVFQARAEALKPTTSSAHEVFEPQETAPLFRYDTLSLGDRSIQASPIATNGGASKAATASKCAAVTRQNREL